MPGENMIIDFTVSNYRSIKEPITISMLATNFKEHPNFTFDSMGDGKLKLLRSTVIYGPNASGKSNIIMAIDALQDLIITSTDLKLDDKIDAYDPFVLDADWSNKPTSFDIEFIGPKSIRYRYYIEFDSNEILKESLVFFPKGQEANLFFRNKGDAIKFGDYYQGPAKIVESQLLKNNLFLSKAANSNNKFLADIYLYFRNKLKISRHISHGGVPIASLTTRICIDKNSGIDSESIQQFLRVADTGIESFEIIEDDSFYEKLGLPKDFPNELKEKIMQDTRYQPIMKHSIYHGEKRSGTKAFGLENESDGTIKLYDLAGKILHVLKNGEVFIADELNSSLHPHLSSFLVGLFNNPETNPNNAQLIFATHDTSLLNSDLFRRDQIWFTEKDIYGRTSLISVSEFDTKKVRSNIPFDKWYLSGRFGAVPAIGDLKNWVKNAKNKTN